VIPSFALEGIGVDREYDIFEKLPDGGVLWLAVVRGHENAIAKLKELAKNSPNEHFVIHTPTKAIIARMNVSESSSTGV
jgi:hypothetical protein